MLFPLILASFCFPTSTIPLKMELTVKTPPIIAQTEVRKWVKGIVRVRFCTKNGWKS
jgi:hypothetical protein